MWYNLNFFQNGFLDSSAFLHNLLVFLKLTGLYTKLLDKLSGGSLEVVLQSMFISLAVMSDLPRMTLLLHFMSHNINMIFNLCGYN